MELTRCPECGQVAEIDARTVCESTDGPIEHVRVRCVARHVFVQPVEWLDREPRPAPPQRPARVPKPVSVRRPQR